MIPLPEVRVNDVDPGVDDITPPDNNPVYKLPSNHLRRVVLEYPWPFWLKYKSWVEPET